jgi:HAD superfamily phosphoserine phosphatase-like hydrolase
MNDKSTAGILKYFKVKNKDKTLKKLHKIIAGGKDKLHLLIDFDRTLTIGKDKAGRDNTSWEILGNHLSSKAHAKQHALYEKYRPLELSEKMTHEEALSWANQVLAIFAKDNINLTEVEKDFQQKTEIRPRAKELLDVSKNLGIPTVILSAGIKQIIDLWSKIFQVSPTLVLATEVITDQNGDIVDWNRNIIHHLNKKEMAHEELTRIKTQRPNTILIGDAIEDADMSDGDENVLRIRIYNPREDEGTDKTDFDKITFEKFDLIIETGTLDPILKILELMN